LRVVYRPGPLAPGMAIGLELELFSESCGDFKETVEIETESSVIGLAVSAHFEEDVEESEEAATTQKESVQVKSDNRMILSSADKRRRFVQKANTFGKLGRVRLMQKGPTVAYQNIFSRHYKFVPPHSPTHRPLVVPK